MKIPMTARLAKLRTVALSFLVPLLWLAGTGTAMANASVTSTQVNGQTTDTVLIGAPITVTVNVTLNGGTDWLSTRLTTSPASSLSICTDVPNITANGSYSQPFTVNAPNVKGTYALVATVYSGTGCTNQTATRSTAGAIKTDTSPRVLSIVREDPTPTKLSPVRWTLTFDREVTGVTLDDFSFANTGVTGLSLSGTYNTGDTSVYFMTTTNTGSGTLGLDIVDNDSIVDLNGLVLGGVGAGNGNFSGEVYTIDRAGPTFPTVSIASNNAVSPLYARTGEIVRVTFTVADATTFTAPTASINGVTATVTGSGANWVASRTMLASDPEGPVTFKLDATDTMANVAPSRTTVTNGSSVTIDRTAPVVSIACASACGTANPVNAGQVSWNVTFSEPVTGVSAANFSLSGTGASGASLVSVSGGPSSYTVVANVSSIGVVGLNFSQNLAAVRDRAGNTPAANSAGAANSYTIGGCSVAAGGGCTFNAVEPGGAIGSPLFTKRVGAAITLNILAMNGTVLNTGSNDSVTVTLVIANNLATCGTVEVSAPQTVDFVAANGGRISVTMNPTRAGRAVRVRMVSSGVTACSLDDFAVRPDAFIISSANANADPAGTSVSATPVFKAGSASFSMLASSSAGYDGTPQLNQNFLQANGAVIGSIGVSIVGGFGVANVASGSVSAAFTYSEVGYVGLRPWGVYDDGSFAAVDRIKGECFDGTALGTAAARPDPNTVNASGRLGCYFGSLASPYFGRFVPDHFAISAAGITNRSATLTCAASPFTYMGEELTPTFRLTAQNAANATTVNYAGSFARLLIPSQLSVGAVDEPAAPPRRPLPACAVAPATAVGPCLSPGVASGEFTLGVSNAISAPVTIVRPASALAPYTALKIGVAPVDSDGVGLASYNLDTVNVVAGTTQRGLIGSTAVRFGRMQIDNAYGSELLNLSVKVSAQYWDGSAYAANTQDSCTPLGSAGFAVKEQWGGITTGNLNAANLVSGSAMLNGTGRVVLSKPTPAPTAKGRAVLKSGSSYLPGTGRVTFGVYKAGPVIYVRETY